MIAELKSWMQNSIQSSLPEKRKKKDYMLDPHLKVQPCFPSFAIHSITTSIYIWVRLSSQHLPPIPFQLLICPMVLPQSLPQFTMSPPDNMASGLSDFLSFLFFPHVYCNRIHHHRVPFRIFIGNVCIFFTKLQANNHFSLCASLSVLSFPNYFSFFFILACRKYNHRIQMCAAEHRSTGATA